MKPTPLWLGASERPVFAWLHLPPAAGVRGAVLLCPPLDREYTNAHGTFRRLAERLATEGLAALRIDYDGTGDSAGDRRDPDRVGAWLSSIDAGLDALRALRAPFVGVVGMRMGALLAAAALSEERRPGPPIDAAVLWDPCPSGRTFLSEGRALALLALPAAATGAEDGSVITPGVVYPPETASALSKLKLASTVGPLGARVLVLTRADRAVHSSLAGRLDAPQVEWGLAEGQAELLDVPAPDQEVPSAAVERVVSWIAQCSPEASVAPTLPPPAETAVVAHDDEGAPIVERPVRLGPSSLFAMETRPASTDDTRPVVLCLNAANETHIGPNRLWVELARRWAARGLRVVRLDLTGLGETPPRPGCAAEVVRAIDHFDDVREAAGAVSPEDPSNVVLVGLCSSAYQAIESALELRPRGVCAVNPILSFPPPPGEEGRTHPRRRVAMPRTGVIQEFHGNGSLSVVRRLFPNLGWRVRAFAARSRRPARWMAELASYGVDALFVCGEAEARPLEQGGGATLARLRRAGSVRLEVVPELDHGLMIASQRESVRELVDAHVLSRFAPPPAPPAVAASPRGPALCG